jgi:hypothetical protein
MAHYAKIEDGVVTQVIVAHSKLWCEETLGGMAQDSTLQPATMRQH